MAAGPREEAMSRRERIYRMILMFLLVSFAVAFAVPANATERRSDTPALEIREILAGRWVPRLLLWLGLAPADEESRVKCDQGSSIDPNGCPKEPSKAGLSIDPNGEHVTTGAESEQGSHIDPNG